MGTFHYVSPLPRVLAECTFSSVGDCVSQLEARHQRSVPRARAEWGSLGEMKGQLRSRGFRLTSLLLLPSFPVQTEVLCVMVSCDSTPLVVLGVDLFSVYSPCVRCLLSAWDTALKSDNISLNRVSVL